MALTFNEIQQKIIEESDIISKSPNLRVYLEPILSLNSIDDRYFLDSGSSICLYFLSNAGPWKTENAKIVKKDLKKLLK